MSAHTPGPWAILTNGVCVSGPDPQNREVGISGVAHCGMARRTEAENRANARLVMAAPDLLEALQNCCDTLDSFVVYGSAHETSVIGKNVTSARAAIAKATGSVA